MMMYCASGERETSAASSSPFTELSAQSELDGLCVCCVPFYLSLPASVYQCQSSKAEAQRPSDAAMGASPSPVDAPDAYACSIGDKRCYINDSARARAS
ncbi:hypothetical protein ZHAS_00004452 [Anopheles sinensis]|uniref:Uncharacterized protein n=1 Tax=Anopheles sinensis TaxID=74873 RepID=A0A084VGZ3_ANOSI|nr:hypothetical protein ZHAS_00004452 [Anopheles sinensis]